MNIIAIGGGNKDSAINHALELTGDQNPSVLLVPSACSTEASYTRKVSVLTEYFKANGLNVAALHDFNERPSDTKISHELGRASLLYTIGGNSPHMMTVMKSHGTDNAIRHAIQNGKVHAGTSAGALLPFELAHSNTAKRPTEEDWDYAFLPMLGLLKGAVTAHANQHDKTPHGIRPDSRMDHLMTHLNDSVTCALAIDNGAAAVLSDQGDNVIISAPDANVHLIERHSDERLSSRVISNPTDLQMFRIS